MGCAIMNIYLRRCMEEAKPTKKQRQSNKMTVIGIVLIAVAVVLFLAFQLNGQMKTTGGFPDSETSVSSTCQSITAEYPFFGKNSADKRDMTIKIIANDEKVDTISLIYKLYYSEEDLIRESRDVNHFEVNRAFSRDGMEADSLGASYAKMGDYFKFTLFAKAVNLNDVTKRYFLLDGLDSNSDGSFNYNKVVKAYELQGFNCVSNDK